MTISELKARLTDENLLSVIDGDRTIKYIDERKVYYDGVFHNTRNVFGVLKTVQHKYISYITDCERGIPLEEEVFETEFEACADLYNMISRIDRIHKKKLAGIIK